MGQRIGNIGRLNLLNATEASIADIESIGNVGIIIYSKQTAHLVAKLNLSNVGKRVLVPEGFRLVEGQFHLTPEWLSGLEEPTRYMTSGTVIVDPRVTVEQLKEADLIIHAIGTVYITKPLYSAIGSVIQGGKLEIYEQALPRLVQGSFVLSNEFLDSLDDPVSLRVAGKLVLADNLDLQLAEEKLKDLNVKGVVKLQQGEQETFFHRKAKSLTGCVIKSTPVGFLKVDRLLRLNNRSLRRFRESKLYTSKPVLMAKDITREELTAAIVQIQSSSFIVCPEQLEDLVYQLCPSLETEVLTYPQELVYVEDDEVWGEHQLQGLPEPVQLVVEGSLTFTADIREETLSQKLSGLDLYGSLIVPDNHFKGLIQPFIRTREGSIRTIDEKPNDSGSFLHNIGELTL